MIFKKHSKLSKTLHRHDILPLVNKAWKEYFGIKENNLKATRDRGWNPLDMHLLMHPDIVKQANTASMRDQQTHTSEALTVDDGS